MVSNNKLKYLCIMEKFYTSDFKLGILGGGQLGRMFIQEAISYNVDVHIMDNTKEAPCFNIATSSLVNGVRSGASGVLDFAASASLFSPSIIP